MNTKGSLEIQIRINPVLERVKQVKAAQNGLPQIEAGDPKWSNWDNWSKFDDWNDKIHWVKY